MNKSKWFFHPILMLIFSIMALAMSFFLYIYWYIEVNTGLKRLVLKFNLNPSQVLESQSWVVIMVLSVLVGIILLGIFTIFVYNQKTIQLYRFQHNFINNFTHELKTPVTSLKLYLETFLKYELNRNDRLKYVGYMLQDVMRLSNDISHILNLAKIDSKNFEGEFVLSDLVNVTKRFYVNNVHLFQNCEINIFNSSSGAFLYKIDISLFEMLLMNLITNAVKYNKSKIPKIDIRFKKEKRRMQICFKDNGVGIGKNEIKKIFKKFYQVGDPDDMTARGSGLGLYLVQSIARIHKGKVIAKSMGIGKGSTFSLILPSSK